MRESLVGSDTQRIECEYDHRLLMVFSHVGLEIKCRTCQRIIVKTWEELEHLRQSVSEQTHLLHDHIAV